MKTKSIGYPAALITAITLAANAGLVPSASDVVKLTQSGISEDVATAYVKNVSTPFHLSADDILALKAQGVSSQIIAAMLNHDAQMRDRAQARLRRPRRPSQPRRPRRSSQPRRPRRSSQPRRPRRSSQPRSMISPRRRPTTHRRQSR